jgi:hypothetical protein
MDAQGAAVRSEEQQKKGSGRSAMDWPPKCSSSRVRTFSPRVMASMGKAMSSSGLESTKARRTRASISASSQPMATLAPTTRPWTAPPTASIGTPAARSARMAPQ